MTSATRRAQPSGRARDLVFASPVARAVPCSQTATAPAIGMQEQRRQDPARCTRATSGNRSFIGESLVIACERAEQRDDADDQHPRIGADLARLQLRPDPAGERGRAARCRSPNRPSMMPDVDAASRADPRRPLTTGWTIARVVRLVYVVLVLEHLLEARSSAARPFRHERAPA